MKMHSIAVQALAIVAMSVASASARVDWTVHARDAIASARLEGDAARSALELMRAAMSEASRHEGNGTNGGSTVDYHAAAASLAAYVVLECLFPEQQLDLEVALAVDLADFPETDQKAAALGQGRRAATQLLRSRSQPCRPNVQAY